MCNQAEQKVIVQNKNKNQLANVVHTQLLDNCVKLNTA